jgi:hypothetical protein
MKTNMFGALVASAVASLLGSAVLAEAGDTGKTGQTGEAKACYRKSCGTSVKGYEGQCGGTKVDQVTDQKTCENAGGAWVTATEAKKLKNM